MTTMKKQELEATTVDSWAELRQKVDDARRTLGQQNDEEVWFRGVSSDKHKLMPSLLRCLEKLNQEATPQNVRSLETALFFEFLARARTGDGLTLDHWDVLFLMQHYRAPTRLLDWTEVLHVALYFAVAYPTPGGEDIPRLYIMNPYAWNEKLVNGQRDLFWPRYFSYDEDDDYFWEYGEILTEDVLDWKLPVALYPPQRDARLSAQRGYFTIHGYDPRPLDEIAPKLIVAIDLTQNAVKEVKTELEHSGINEFALFPDLEGLSRYLKKKYGIDK
jgi:FRG domain